MRGLSGAGLTVIVPTSSCVPGAAVVTTHGQPSLSEHDVSGRRTAGPNVLSATRPHVAPAGDPHDMGTARQRRRARRPSALP
ncbi:hypothetical protein GCM10009858_27320 [Terrabacter carboxydivorans]|uniref:Uncharacterized protein n=1 Tax=Terrabacter carboxydivorans TaxID=619730 RepID=A0ABN3LRS3_9MICO